MESLKTFEEKEKIQAKYRAPAAADRNQDWVMRGGVLTPIPRGTARQGDVPHDPVAARGGTGGARLSAVAIEKLAGLEQSLVVLKSLEGLVQDGWLGPIQGRVTEAKVGLPGAPVSDQLARFYAETATLKNAVVKAVTGAQMSEPEAQRILTQVPSFADKPNVWRQKANATRDNLSMLRDRTIALSGGGAGIGGDVDDAPPAPPGWRYVPKPGGGWTAVEVP